MIKIPFLYISVDKNGKVYYDSVGNVIINNKVKTLPVADMKPYFFYKLDFDRFENISVYKSPNFYSSDEGFITFSRYKIYHLNVYLNMKMIIGDKHLTKKLYDQLAYILIISQQFQIRRGQKFLLFRHMIREAIKLRESSSIEVYPYTTYSLSSQFVFDLVGERIILDSNVSRLKFKHRGGIIEINQPYQIKKFFEDDERNLIIVPNNMKKIWLHGTIYTYDELFNLKEKKVNKLIKKCFSRIIIHECHYYFINGLKKILKRIDNDQNIWIINTLPLSYYLSTDTLQKKLSLSKIFTLCNIWIKLNDVDQKKKYKKDLSVFFLKYFNTMYFRIHIPLFSHYECLSSNSFSLERKVYDILHNIFKNWKYKLSNDPENYYSFALEKNVKKIEKNILKTTILFSSAIVSRKNLTKFFLLSFAQRKQQLLKMLMTYSNLKKGKKKLINNFSTFIDQLNKTIDKDFDKCQKIDYTQTNSSCPICCEEFQIQTVSYCGHSFCLECYLNSFSLKKECPLCRAENKLDILAIIKESLGNYQFSLGEFVNTLKDNSIIITDIPNLNNIFPSKNKLFLNIHKNDICGKIRNINHIENVYLFLYHDNPYHAEICQLLGYFSSFDVKPSFYYYRIV